MRITNRSVQTVVSPSGGGTAGRLPKLGLCGTRKQVFSKRHFYGNKKTRLVIEANYILSLSPVETASQKISRCWVGLKHLLQFDVIGV